MEKQKKIRSQKEEKKYENQISLETIRAVNKFKEWMEQKRYSKSTIKTYISFILHFFSLKQGKGWDEIEMKDITDYNYKKFILGKQSYSSQNQFINAIKLFYQFHGKGKVVPEEIERPRQEKHLPDVLTKKEIASIIRCASNIKHKCLLAFVYGGGLRIGEALDLRLRDIRVDEKLLYIRMAKGRKDRRVPLSQKMMELYRDYKASHLPQFYLFEGQKGGKYSRTSAVRVLQKCVTKAEIQGRITLHTLRHSYATHLMDSGVGLRYIQEILGHSSPKTTMIYTHISGKRLSEIKSPLDDLGL